LTSAIAADHGALSHEPPIARLHKRNNLLGLTPSSPSLVSESIINESCRWGAIDRSIEPVKKALCERVGILSAALERELPEVRFMALGGCFLWLDLLSSVYADALSRVLIVVKELTLPAVRARSGSPSRA
jgi:DNA-binding transcriptional MocR family regulator